MKLFSIEIILIINSAIAILNLIVRFIMRKYRLAIVTSLLILIAPIIGPLYLLSSWLFYFVFLRNRNEDINLDELSMSKDRIKVVQRPDSNEALNIVPFEEAFIVSDRDSVRRLLLDSLKQDEFTSMEHIIQAISHSDSEVSHYAAAALSDIIDDFISSEKVLKNTMYDTQDMDDCKSYLEYVNSYLARHVLPKDEQLHFLASYEQAVRYMEKHFQEHVNGQIYLNIINLHLHEEAYDLAKVWVEKALKNHDDELETYKGALKYYYMTEDRETFNKLISNLKSSDVVLDYETVEMIRFISS